MHWLTAASADPLKLLSCGFTSLIKYPSKKSKNKIGGNAAFHISESCAPSMTRALPSHRLFRMDGRRRLRNTDVVAVAANVGRGARCRTFQSSTLALLCGCQSVRRCRYFRKFLHSNDRQLPRYQSTRCLQGND